MALSLLVMLAAGVPGAVGADTLDARYPGLAMGLLKSAVLSPMDEDTLLIAGDIRIQRSQLSDVIQDQDPGMRVQLEKNLLFLLEQEAARLLLLGEARKAGIDITGGDDDRAIQALFEHYTRALTVSEEEARTFYAANQEMVGGASFEQVGDGIRQYLLQDKKQQAVGDAIAGLGDSTDLRINKRWVEAQSRLAGDNPVDQARRSGRPTMVEFGATGCAPCDMMQPIIDNLRRDYPQKLNVVFVHVGEEQLLAARYGIRSIPVQVFFDARGAEVFRHVGFFAQDEITRQLVEMGVEK